MSVFTQAVQIYKEYGYEVRTGLNPAHFNGFSPTAIPFTFLYQCAAVDAGILETGGGISPIEVYLFESLGQVFKPKNIYIIGNAFGWSTIVMALAFPGAKIVVIDAGTDGRDNHLGINLTRRICNDKQFNCHIEFGYSPQDNGTICQKHFGNEKIDLVFIDGLHTNEQLIKDFESSLSLSHADTLYIHHDVVNWNLNNAFQYISQKLSNHDSYILTRTTSGIGINVPNGVAGLDGTLAAFKESDDIVARIEKRSKVHPAIAYLWHRTPPFIKQIIQG